MPSLSGIVKSRDAAVMGVLVLCGCVIGWTYVGAARRSHARPAQPTFNERVFGAALMSVCGRGLTTPTEPTVVAADTPPAHIALRDFLAQRRETIACRDIPSDVKVDGLDGMQRASRYLLWLVTGAWTLSGPRWAGIDALLGFMYGLTVALAYLVCRLGMSRIVAALMAALLMVSPLQLANLVDLRDYAKAPFFVASLLFTGLIVLRRRRPADVVALAAGAGAVLGFGFGVRTDIAVNLAMVIAAVAAFLPEGLKDSWKVRVAAVGACLVAFAAVASPVLRSGESSSNLWHWALLGYAHEWDGALGVAAAPYETSYFYSDSFVATAVDAYWGRVTDSPVHVSVGVPEYPEASRGYYAHILSTFPSDALLRGWASLLRILELPYSGLQSMPRGLLPDMLWRAIGFVQAFLGYFAGLGLLLFTIAVLSISAWNVRLATLTFGLVVMLGAYPAIQFQRRHMFHLELLSLWVLGFVVSSLISKVVQRTREPALPKTSSTNWRRPARFAIAVALLVILPMTVLRAYQQRHVVAWLASYDDARLEAIEMAPEVIGHGLVRVASGETSLPRPRGPRSMYSDMLVAEVSAAGCTVDRSALTFRYMVKDPSVDFTRTYDIDILPGQPPTRVYFPVYETGGASPDPQSLLFGGIEVAASELPCLKRVSRFAEPDGFPLLLPVVLPGDWHRLAFHQTLRGWERDPLREGRTPLSYWAPGSLRDRSAALIARSAAAAPGLDVAVDYQSRIARVRSDGITVNGVAEATGSYLVAWKNKPLEAFTIVAAEGELEQGGLTVGLVDDTGWVARVDIDTPGTFRALVQAPRAGQYQVVVGNHLSDGSLRNRFTISRIAVMSAEHE